MTSSTPDDLDARLAARARLRWQESTALVLAAESGTESDADGLVDGALARLDDAARAQPESSSVTQLDRRRPRAWGGWLGAAAGALAAALLVSWLRPTAPDLPRYEASFEGGLRSERGDETTPDRIVLLPSSRVRWSFVPATATDRLVQVRIEARGPTRVCLEPGGVRRSDTGAVEAVGPAADVLDLPAGPWELTALLATRDRFAELADPCSRGTDGARPDGVLELDRRSIEIRAAP